MHRGAGWRQGWSSLIGQVPRIAAAWPTFLLSTPLCPPALLPYCWSTDWMFASLIDCLNVLIDCLIYWLFVFVYNSIIKHFNLLNVAYINYELENILNSLVQAGLIAALLYIAVVYISSWVSIINTTWEVL